MITTLLPILEDGFFAAIAGIGFAIISNPPRRIFPYLAIVAACGHMTRYCLMTFLHIQISLASLIAALVIGFLSLPFALKTNVPPESLSFPSLLPMVPGMYAYRSVHSLVMCLAVNGEQEFMHYLYLLQHNWMTCIVTIIAMVVGVTFPILIFKKFSFRVTRLWN